MKVKRLGIAILASAVLHGSCIGIVGDVSSENGFFAQKATLVESGFNSWRVQSQRAQLVEDARAAFRQNNFRLGEFIIRANEIDLRERGVEFNGERARERYNELLAEFRERIERGESVEIAISSTLDGEFRYVGDPERTMLEMLEKNGGLCVPIAHIETSMLFDAGFGDNAFLRYYGGGENDAHLAPIFSRGNTNYDVRDGDFAVEGGSQFHSSLLPELYALRHGLEAVVPMRREDGSQQEYVNSGCFAYPDSDDIYPSGNSLFQRNAVVRPRRSMNDGQGEREATRTVDYSAWERLAIQDLRDYVRSEQREEIPTGIVLVTLNSDVQEVEESEPNNVEHRIDVLSRTIREAELVLQMADEESYGRRAVAIGYMIGLLERIEAEVDGTDDADLREVGRRANERKRELQEQGTSIIRRVREQAEGIMTSDDMGMFVASINITSRNTDDTISLWQLSFIGDEGNELMLGLLGVSRGDMFNPLNERDRSDTLLALLANEETREQTGEILGRLSRVDQIETIARYYEMEHYRSGDRPAERPFFINADDELGIVFTAYSRMQARVARSIDSGLNIPQEFNESLQMICEITAELGMDDRWRQSFVNFSASENYRFLNEWMFNGRMAVGRRTPEIQEFRQRLIDYLAWARRQPQDDETRETMRLANVALELSGDPDMTRRTP